MTTFFPALEAIAFQNGSKLATGLIDIFQSCIDIRKQERNDRTTLTNTIIDHFTKTSIPKIKALVKKETGMIISNVVVSKKIDFGYACMMKVGDMYGWSSRDIIKRYSGIEREDDISIGKLYLKHVMNVEPTTADELIKLSEAFSKESGTLGDGMFRTRNVEMDLYFDPYSAFLAKEHGHIKFEYMTAPEVAAIVLHEIGHMLTLIEHCADHYKKMQAFDHACTNFLKKATIKEQIKYVKTLVSNEDKSKNVDEIVDVVIKTPDNPLAVVGKTLLIMALLLFILKKLNIKDILMPLIRRMITEMKLASRDVGKKRSDFASTRADSKYCERLADEYVSRHGLSGPLASALYTLSDMTTTMLVGPRSSRSSIYYYTAKLPWLLTLITCGDVSGAGETYDRSKLRIEQIMLNTLSAFKQSDVSPELLDLYIKDYEAAKAIFTDRGLAAKMAEGAELIHRLISYLVNPASLFQMISSGRFNAEYNKLAERVDRIVSNNLLYRAAKLEQLLNKEYKV